MSLIPIILVILGITLSVKVIWESYVHGGDDKRGVVAGPFMFITAAAVTQYIINSL